MNTRKKYYATVEIEVDVIEKTQECEQARYIYMLLNQMNLYKVNNESGMLFYIQRINNLFVTDEKGKQL